MEEEFRDVFSPAADLYKSDDGHIGSEKQGVRSFRDRVRASGSLDKISIEEMRRIMDEKESDVPIVSVSSPYD